MRQVQKYFLRQVICEQECPLLTTKWAEIESFAAERTKVIMIAVWIGAFDSSDSFEVVAAGTESFTDFLNTFESEATILLAIPFFVLITKILEVFFENGMELISPTGYVYRVGRG